MSREDLRSQARAIAERVARSYGLEIFEVQLRRESIGWVLRVVLDRVVPDAGGAQHDPRRESVTIDDCQQVSHDLSAVLDAEFDFGHAYTLEVSSPGLDRPLRDLDDCRRFVGCLAKIVTREAVDGQRHVAGRITAVDGGDVLVETDRRVYRIPWSVVSRARLEVEF